MILRLLNVESWSALCRDVFPVNNCEVVKVELYINVSFWYFGAFETLIKMSVIINTFQQPPEPWLLMTLNVQGL